MLVQGLPGGEVGFTCSLVMLNLQHCVELNSVHVFSQGKSEFFFDFFGKFVLNLQTYFLSFSGSRRSLVCVLADAHAREASLG